MKHYKKFKLNKKDKFGNTYYTDEGIEFAKRKFLKLLQIRKMNLQMIKIIQ